MVKLFLREVIKFRHSIFTASNVIAKNVHCDDNFTQGQTTVCKKIDKKNPGYII